MKVIKNNARNESASYCLGAPEQKGPQNAVRPTVSLILENLEETLS